MRSKLTNDILHDRRQYFIESVKAPLRKTVVALGKLYPTATKENTNWPNTQILIDAANYMLEHDKPSSRRDMIQAALNVIAGEVEHDRYYKFRFNKWLGRLMDSGWDFDMVYVDSSWKED